MPKFAYAAIDPQGAPVEGVTKADTLGSARALLVEQNLFPTKIEESRGMLDFELTKEKVKKKELMHFTRQLAVFVKAGIPITDALVTIGDETEDVALRRAISALTDDLRNGGLLSVAAAKGHPECFPDYYVGILQSAELTGQLDTALESLAEYLERETRHTVQGRRCAVISDGRHGDGDRAPCCCSPATCLPQFKPLFEELGADLPLPTRMMLFFSRFFTDLWFITAGLLARLRLRHVVSCSSIRRARSGSSGWSCKIPIISGIIDYAILETILPHPRCDGAGGRPASRRPSDGDRGDIQRPRTSNVSQSPRSRSSKAAVSQAR